PRVVVDARRRRRSLTRGHRRHGGVPLRRGRDVLDCRRRGRSLAQRGRRARWAMGCRRRRGGLRGSVRPRGRARPPRPPRVPALVAHRRPHDGVGGRSSGRPRQRRPRSRRMALVPQRSAVGHGDLTHDSGRQGDRHPARRRPGGTRAEADVGHAARAIAPRRWRDRPDDAPRHVAEHRLHRTDRCRGVLGRAARIRAVRTRAAGRGLGACGAREGPMTRPFRFAVIPSKAADAHAWRERARRAEALGYTTLLMPDHFQDQLAPLTALATAAAVTDHLAVGTLVFDNDYRHPVVLAKELATLDLLTGGRVEVGIGAGWKRSDYDETGMAYDAPGARIDRMVEAIEVMRALWTSTEPVHYAGTHYRIDGAVGTPSPYTSGGPV